MAATQPGHVMPRFYLLSTAINGFLAVVLGAFGAHALKAILLPELLEIWQTAVHYQMFHGLALLAVAGFAQAGNTSRALQWSGRLFIAGLLIFCGSLYLLALTDIRALGAITPIGGVAWLIAWALLGKAAYLR
jgi:uncharacterized membrane protein YgdD (TMEM256/DUF423 family)